MVFKAKVRGIYSTAITKLLLENDFEIIEPSIPIQQRFNLQPKQGVIDLKIKDRFDRQGIHVIGTPEATEKFLQIIRLNLFDVITRKWLPTLDGIYKGIVIDKRGENFLVDIGVATGLLPEREAENLKENEEVLVQVERRRIGAKYPILTSKIKILGAHAILIPVPKVGVSLKIRDLKKRFELYELGRKVAPENWGVIWRSSAANKSFETLKKEITCLREKAEEVKRKAVNAKAPSVVLEGLYCLDVEFPAVSKAKLDEIRKKVTPTLKGHHMFKAYGGNVSSLLEMAEKLIEKGEEQEKVESLFKQQISSELPLEGSKISIEHVKLSGKIFNLGTAVIEKIDDEKITFRRVFQKPGIYDGLGIRKEPGDNALSNVKIFDWKIETSYFSANGNYKGTYVNINTPVELYPDKIRYVDLEVDVCILPDESVRILDEDKLWKFVNKGFISRKLAEFALNQAKNVAEERSVK